MSERISGVQMTFLKEARDKWGLISKNLNTDIHILIIFSTTLSLWKMGTSRSRYQKVKRTLNIMEKHNWENKSQTKTDLTLPNLHLQQSLSLAHMPRQLSLPRIQHRPAPLIHASHHYSGY